MRRLAALALVLAGCPAPPPPPPPSLAPPPKMVTYSEPSSVTGLAVAGATLMVGTSAGLERWDLETGARKRVAESDGVPGKRVRALAPVPDAVPGAQLWVGTNTALVRYDVSTGKGTALPAPLAAHARALQELRVLAHDPAGGVWVGSKAGLYHADFDGVWQPAGYQDQVTALHVGGDTLWVGTPDGVLERNAGGVLTRWGVAQGLNIAWVSQILEGPQGEVVVVGYDAKGEHQIAFLEEGAFSTFRLSPATAILGVVRRPDQLLLVVPGRVLTLTTLARGGVAARELARDGLHLAPVLGKKRRTPYRIRVLPAIPPPEVTVLAATATELFAGTRTVGTARLALGGTAAQRGWLRPHELVAGAISLTVACRDAKDCYVATGGHQAWRFDGKLFTPLTIQGVPPAQTVILAVVRAPGGEILALYRGPREHVLRVAQLGKEGFAPDPTLLIETPRGVTALTFTKFSRDGLLWVGLQYLDDEGDARPFGVATIDLSLNVVSYHHEDAKAKTGILPVPNDVVDVAFLDDEIWLASKSGAARIKGEQVRVWSEADDLRSELLHGVVATEGGVIYVASASGVGEFDGTRWSYPRQLALKTNAIARGPDGRLWMGTPRGLVVFDGKSTVRYDRRSGLLDETIENIAVDDQGRVWARSDVGLTVLWP